MKYCPKCGKAINDEFEFCTNCGAKISHNLTTHTESGIRVKKPARYIVIFSVIVVIIVIAISAFFTMRKPLKMDTLSGKYNSFGGYSVYTFIPDSKKENMGTYEEQLDADEPITFTGEWVVADERVTLIDDYIVALYASAGVDFTEHYDGTTYMIISNYRYLIDLKSVFNETVPDEEQFDATFTKSDSWGGDVKYVFHRDGTFEHTQSFMTPAKGKYTRKENLIVMESDSGYIYRLFAYNKKLYEDGYYKVEE